MRQCAVLYIFYRPFFGMLVSFWLVFFVISRGTLMYGRICENASISYPKKNCLEKELLS